MSFPRNTDVSKHLAPKIYRTTPQIAFERLATPDELALRAISPIPEAIGLPVSTGPQKVLCAGSAGHE